VATGRPPKRGVSTKSRTPGNHEPLPQKVPFAGGEVLAYNLADSSPRVLVSCHSALLCSTSLFSCVTSL